MLSGNRGEWSEVYTLFKIISDGNLYAGDEDLEKIQNLFFPIIKILRDESNGTFEFEITDTLVLIDLNGQKKEIAITKFHELTLKLYNKISTSKGATFTCPEVEEFLSSFGSTSLKASSTVKSDIRILIHDKRIGTGVELGFSIKSQLGSPSTLLNAGKTTNFIFKIVNLELTLEQIQNINKIKTRSKIKDRIDVIKNLGGKFEFIETENGVFGDNLTLIDSSLPQILGSIVYLFYSGNYSRIHDLVAEVATTNPLGYSKDNGHPFYHYKIKRFLSDVALGMMPSKVWTGNLDATGGYLVVKEDGEILCYHIYNRNEFENYLLKNTKLETASSTRHDFGKIIKENDNYFFKLNLQVRFLN